VTQMDNGTRRRETVHPHSAAPVVLHDVRVVQRSDRPSDPEPAAATAFASIDPDACPDNSRTPSMAVVAGTVRDGDSHQPLASARVTVSWTTWEVDARTAKGSARSVEVSSDSLGRYRVCGVPAGALLAVTARSGERRSEPIVVPALHGGEIAMRELRVGKGSGVPE